MNKLFDTHNSHSPAGGLELLSQDGPSHALVVRSHTLHHGPHLPREVRSGQVRSWVLPWGSSWQRSTWRCWSRGTPVWPTRTGSLSLHSGHCQDDGGDPPHFLTHTSRSWPGRSQCQTLDQALGPQSRYNSSSPSPGLSPSHCSLSQTLQTPPCTHSPGYWSGRSPGPPSSSSSSR